MASQAQILEILSGASGPVGRVELEEKVGQKYQTFQTQLDRYVKQGLLEDTGDHHYILTEKGRDEALRKNEFLAFEATENPHADGESGGTTQEPARSEESLQTTEYQQFLKLGMQTGVVPMALIKQTADHIWAGGSYKDLKWVAQGMQEMGIRTDLRNRWFHSWRSTLKQPLPLDIPSEFFTAEAQRAEDQKKADEKTGKREYILNEDDIPVYIGPGLGNLDYKDAVDISKLRIGRGKGATAANTASPGDALASKAVDKVLERMDNPAGEEPDDQTTKTVAQVRAVKELITEISGSNKGQGDDLTGVLNVIRAVKELIGEKKEGAANNPPATRNFLIDKSTGETKEIAVGQPIIIQTGPQNPSVGIQFDKDGNPLVPPNLDTWLKLEDFKGDQQRKQEAHQVKMDVIKAVKDLAEKGAKVAERMARRTD